MKTVSPAQELFGCVLAKLYENYPDCTYDTMLPPENTPYPFIYLHSPLELQNFHVKGSFLGQSSLTIDVWHNNPRQQGTLDSLLFSVRQILRSVSTTMHYTWCVSSCSTQITADSTTSEPLIRGRLSVEFKYFERKQV